MFDKNESLFLTLYKFVCMSRKTFLFVLPVLVLLHFSVAAQSDSAHYFSSFDNTPIYYEVKGSGYPVVLLHGFMNTSQNWKHTQVYKSLLDAGYKVIILDLRGNGKSGKPHTDEAYANDAEAKDVMGLLTSLQVKHYDVVGLFPRLHYYSKIIGVG